MQGSLAFAALLSVLLLADPQPGQAPQAAPARTPTYLEINLGLKDVDLAALLKSLEIKLPFAVAGRLTFRIQLAIPTNMPREYKAYRLKGTASLAWFTLEGLRLEQVQARVSYADGVLQLEELKGQVPPKASPPAGPAPPGPANPPGVVGKPAPEGSFDGTARVELFPAGNLKANLNLQRLPLTRLAGVVPGLAENVSGVFTGAASVEVPVNQLQDVKTWQASATLQSERLTVFGVRSDSLSARVSLRDAQFRVSELKGVIETGPVTGSGELNLTAPYPYQGKLDLRRIDLALWQRINKAIRPPVAVGGRFHLKTQIKGTLTPFTFRASGEAGAEELTLDRVKVNNVDFTWEGDTNRLVLSQFTASLDQGTLTGSVTLPLEAKAAGKLDLRIKGLDLGTLSASLPALPVRFAGQASGTVKAASPPPTGKQQREWTIDMALRSPRLQLQGIPAQAVTGSVTYKQHVAEYRLQGETLGGTFDLEGQMSIGQPATPPEKESRGGQPPEQDRLGGCDFCLALPDHPPAPDGVAARQCSEVPVLQAEPLSGTGRLRLDRLRLERIWALLGLEGTLGPLQGTFNAELTFRLDASGSPVGRGSWTVRGLRWRETRFAENELSGSLVLEQQELRVSFRSPALGGDVGFQSAINFLRSDRGWFTLDLENVDLCACWLPGRSGNPTSRAGWPLACGPHSGRT